MRRVGEIDLRFDLVRESWRDAGPLEVSQNGSAVAIRAIDSTIGGNVISVREFRPLGTAHTELSKPPFEIAVPTVAEPRRSLIPNHSSEASGSLTEGVVESKTGAPNAGASAFNVKGAGALLVDWCRALRLHHWIKNLILFVPLALSHNPIPLSIWIATSAGFLLLSICASGTYIINDILDREADRAHAQKQYRPFAAGRIGINGGLSVAGVLIAGSLAGATFLSSAFSALLLLYLALTLAYSLKLKRLPLLDVATLAGLHTLRLAMGIVLSHSLLPGALVFAASLAFLSLALAKRYSEIIHRGAEYSASTSGRGYFATDATIALVVGVGCALVATQVTVFYLLEILPTEMLSPATLLWSVPILSCIWLVRVWLFANRGQLNEDLAMFALRDSFTAAVAVCVAGSVLLAG